MFANLSIFDLFLFFLNVFIAQSRNTVNLRMPDEGDPHSATWMAYGATIDAWGASNFDRVQRLTARKDLMRIVAYLCRIEPVKMVINSYDLTEAQQFLTQVINEESDINFGSKSMYQMEAECNLEFVLQPVDDLWTRDTSCVFVNDDKNYGYGINLNFNGWGQVNTGAAGWTKDPLKAKNGIQDQVIKNDQKIADFIIKRTGVTKVSTWLVMEGGGIEVNGKGTAICTESCILNNNRNPKRSKSEVETELKRIFGLKKIIWLPGLKGGDITDGHIDFYARFVGDSKVVYLLDTDLYSPEYGVTLQNQQILSNATDAFGNKIIAIPLFIPNTKLVKKAVISRNNWTNTQYYFNDNVFAAGYIGFYLTNKFVLMSKFGDSAADSAAFNTLQIAYPNRQIIQIFTDGIANAGGSIHCATQQQIPSIIKYASIIKIHGWKKLLIAVNVLLIYTFDII